MLTNYRRASLKIFLRCSFRRKDFLFVPYYFFLISCRFSFVHFRVLIEETEGRYCHDGIHVHPST